MKKLLTLLALTMLATPAFAAEWIVNPATSKLAWQAKFNGQAINGVFKNWKSRIVFDPANLATSSIIIQVDVESIESGDASRDATLKTADWFDAKQFAVATFTSQKINAMGAPGSNQYAAGGTLSINGVTKPLALPFTLNINGNSASGQGQISISRGAFEVGKGEWKNNAEIGDLVVINYTVNATTK